MATRQPTPSFHLKIGSLIRIPVKSYTGPRNADSELVNVHRECAEQGANARLGINNFCKACDALVPRDLIAPAYKGDDGQWVIFSKDEIAALAQDADKEMDVLAFVPAEEVNPLYLGPSNFLGPLDKDGAKIFQLFHQSMRRLKRAAVVAYKYRGRDKVGILSAFPDTLVLFDAFYPTEMRSFAEANTFGDLMAPQTFTPAELKRAGEFIDQLAAPFTDAMAQPKDEFLLRVKARIAERLANPDAPILAPVPVRTPAKVIDLEALLSQSIQLSRPKRAVSIPPEPAPSKTAVKKATAKARKAS